MSFFERSPPPPPRPSAHRPPPWVAPPENELGVAVPIRDLLARTDELALALLDVVAYSTGFALRLGLRVHPESTIDPRGLMTQLQGWPTSGDEQLRFGIEFADGRRAGNFEPWHPSGEESRAISITPRAGASGGRGLSLDVGYWIYPLPPPGTITLATDWPARALPETRRELDAGLILEAAAQCEQLWEETRPIGRRPPPSTGEIRIS